MSLSLPLPNSGTKSTSVSPVTSWAVVSAASVVALREEARSGAASLLPAGTRVTFLGSDRNTVGAVNGGDYARQRARRCVGHRRPCGSCVACCRWMTEPRTSPPSASAESCMLCAPHVSRLMVEPLAGGSTDGPEWRLR